MISKYLEVHERLFEDKEQNVLWIAMFDQYRKFTEFAYASLEDKELIRENMPFYVYQSKNKKYCQNNSRTHLQEVIIGQKAPPGYKIDHENSNGLDNRRENLRIVSDGVNSHNRVKKEGCSSEYFGVCAAKGNKWKAGIQFEEKSYNLGTFDREEEAAKVYDMYAVHFYKHLARINTKDGKYFLTKEEVADIYKNGIPEQYQRKKKERDLPTCIYRRGERFYYEKCYNYQKYKKAFDTQEEAEEGLRLLIEGFEEEERKKREEIENNIVRNKGGVAVLYMRNIEGKIEGDLRVDDHVWKKFIHTSWSMESGEDERRGAGTIDGKLASIHTHIWRTFVGPIPPKMSIDHIDQDPSNNVLANLRLATASLQSHNKTMPLRTCFRYKGIRGSRGNFIVQFKRKHIGYFYYEEDAIRAYNEAATEEYGENAALIPEPGNTRTRVADYFSNLSIAFIESLDTATDIQELFCVKPKWGRCCDIDATNYKKYRALAVRLRTEEIENNFIDEPLPIFSLDYIQKIRLVKQLVKLFKDRPDWKRQHKVNFDRIKRNTFDEYKALAIRSKFEEMDNLPPNDAFKPIVCKIDRDEDLNNTDEIVIQLPTVQPLMVTPMKELRLSYEEDTDTEESFSPVSESKLNTTTNNFVMAKSKVNSLEDEIQLPEMPSLSVIIDVPINQPCHENSNKDVGHIPVKTVILSAKQCLPVKKCNLPTGLRRDCKSDIQIPKIPISTKLYF